MQHTFAQVNDYRNQFRGPVVGPIGTHIKIAPGKEQYAQVAELALGNGVLDRFIVTNDADRKLLMKIRREVGCSTRDCGIFQMSEGSRYNVPPPPCTDVETVESVTHVENDLVYNCLVDNCKIDVKALSSSKDDSERALLIEDEHGKESIRGGRIQQVYFLPKGDFWQVKGSNRSMVSNDNPNLKKTIGVDRSAAIENAKKEFQMLDKELNELRSKEASIVEQSKSVKLKWNQETREARKTDNRIKVLQDTLDTLHEEAESAENITIDTTEFEQDVKNAEIDLEKLIEKEKECKQIMEDHQPHVEQLKRRLEEITTRNKSVIADLETAEKNLENCLKMQAYRQEILKKKEKKLDQAREAKEQQEQNLKNQIETTNDTMEKARLLTHQFEKSKAKEDDIEGEISIESIEPIVTEKDPTYYKAKINQYEKKIEDERKKRAIKESDPAVAFEQYQRAMEDFQAKSKTIDEVVKKAETLSHDLNDRRKRWKIFRKHIATMTNETFDDMLNKKGSSGQIEFNHQDRTLDLIVQKDNTNENTQTSDVKALR